MPKLRNHRLEKPSVRLALKPRNKPYTVKVSKGCALGYRRVKQGPGAWYVRVREGGAEWVKRIATAADHEQPAPPDVLDYFQALDVARKLARGRPDDPPDASRPTTVQDAINQYRQHLKVSGGGEYNADWLLVHLTDAALSKPVSLLTANELARWRDTLVAKRLAPATVNRVRNCLRACLTLAAKRDKRIRNAAVWQDDLDALPNAQRSRNLVLDPADVSRVITAAYATDDAFGLLVNVLAETGTRPSQAVRLEVGDLDVKAARLQVPRSAKGHPHKRSDKRNERVPVPIPTELARRLAAHAKGRKPDELLLRRSNGDAWGFRRNDHYRAPFAAVVASLGLAEETTPYSLRHSYISRCLIAGMPVFLVAELADTSESVIRRHYAPYLSHHAGDPITRLGLLPVDAGNVVPIGARRSS